MTGDWSEVGALAAELEVRLNKADRRTLRAQAMRDEIIDIMRGAFPGRDEGLILVVDFQARFFQRRWIGVLRHVPVIGESVRVRAAFVQDESDGCAWSRYWQRNKALTRAQVRRLDRLVRRLDRQGVFNGDLARACLSANDGFWWARDEPEAYPGLDRLVVTVDPVRPREDPARPNPPRPLAFVHHIADARVRARSAEDFLGELDLAFRILLGWSLDRKSATPAQCAAPAERAEDISSPATASDGEPPF